MMTASNILLAQAQTLDGVSAGFWKDFCIGLMVLLGVAVAILSIWSLTRKPAATRINDDPPIEIRKAPKRYNHDLTEARFMEIDRRLTAHEKELKDIQEDRAKTLRHINGRFERLLVGLTAIATKVGARMPADKEPDTDR